MIKYKTSVIVPVYNTEDFLDECIQSVLNQTQKEVELILIDDGSTDNSYEIMRSYAERHENIKVLRQENKKLGAARNLGLKNALGKYIFFLDSDDYMTKNCLKEVYDCAEKHDADFVTYDAENFIEYEEAGKTFPDYDRSRIGIDENRIYRGLDFLNTYFLRGGAFVSACLSCYRASFLKENDICFSEQIYYEDNEFAIKVCSSAKRMMYLPQKLYVRRYRPDSIMTAEIGIVHLQSAMKMNEVCLGLLTGIWSDAERQEGIRGIISILACRLLKQMQGYKNKTDLYNNSYLKELCPFFTTCDRGRLLSSLGLELAFDYYCVFSAVLEWGCLDEMQSLKERLQADVTDLKKRIKCVTDRLLIELNITSGNKGDIVIYGTGDIAGKIADCYTKIYGRISGIEERIIFANTRVGSENLYAGRYPLRAIGQVSDESVSVIIVASTRYEYDMCAQLMQLYGNKYNYITYRELANRSIVDTMYGEDV